ncbi:ribosomal protein L7/L12 [Amycolatopsis circi]|uniref:ribosomal protein L7/L12 n=1 Tax=Amycolatopsis circi TaxID=871959 RepID=UPI001ABF8324|nr:ribosomal protein L7/L12 [Amycolatopsis circi]
MNLELLWLIVALLILGIVLSTGWGSSTRSLERRMTRLERKLDLVLDHLGVRKPTGDLVAELEPLLREGKTIAAIKRYREVTGAGLKEAKDAVDRMSHRAR